MSRARRDRAFEGDGLEPEVPPDDERRERDDDIVFVDGLELEVSLGVLEHERRHRQPLVLDIELTLDGTAPVEGKLASVYDYRAPVEFARRLAAAGHVDLVEVFVDRLAALCLEDARVRRVRIRAVKPRAIPGAAGAGVAVSRRREP